MISMINYRRGARQRILYSSIVNFCDRLRAEYFIADRRAPLPNPILRHRDEDLLPFPLTDTICIAETMRVLGYDWHKAVIALIDEGCFEAYRLIPGAGSPWRVSRSSLARFLASTRNKPAAAGLTYKRMARPRVDMRG